MPGKIKEQEDKCEEMLNGNAKKEREREALPWVAMLDCSIFSRAGLACLIVSAG